MILFDILQNKCPHCKTGKIYNERLFAFSYDSKNMNLHCPVCHFSNHKEPGFFYGAMYVSYGLAVAEAIITYVISSFLFPRDFDPRIIGIIVFVIIAFSAINLKLARIIWIYIFRNYAR